MKNRRITITTITGLILLFIIGRDLSCDEFLLKDTFELVLLKSWHVIDQGENNSPSNWYVDDGILVQKSNIYGSRKGNLPGTMLITGKRSWKNIVFEVQLRSFDDDGIGVVFNYRDTDNFYRLRFMGTDKSNKDGIVMERVVDGVWQVVAADDHKYDDNNWHDLRVVLTGKRIIVFYDDFNEPLFDISDINDSNMSGKTGLYTWGNSKSYFDNFTVRKMTVLTDMVIPSRLIPVGKMITVDFSAYNVTDKPCTLSVKLEGEVSLINQFEPWTIQPLEKKRYTIKFSGNKPGEGRIIIQNDRSQTISSTDLLVIQQGYIPLFGDFHMHTTYSDGKHTPIEMVIQSKIKGQDVIAITDHGTTEGSHAGNRFVKEQGLRMLVINAEENGYDFSNTHILVFNHPDNMIHLRDEHPDELEHSPEVVLSWAMANNMTVIQAHPVWDGHKGTRREKLEFTRYLLEEGYVHGFELFNGAPEDEINVGMAQFYTSLQAEGVQVSITGGSDAHSKNSLGTIRTMIFAASYSTDAVLEALHAKRTVVMNADGSIMYGPQPWLSMAKIIVEDFLQAHDSLAAKEGELIYRYWGGHQEVLEDYQAIDEEWDSLYKHYFPWR